MSLSPLQSRLPSLNSSPPSLLPNPGGDAEPGINKFIYQDVFQSRKVGWFLGETYSVFSVLDDEIEFHLSKFQPLSLLIISFSFDKLTFHQADLGHSIFISQKVGLNPELLEEIMSPRLGPEELKRAKEQKKKEMEEHEKELEARRRENIKLRIRWEQISSELDGLYKEIDKLYRKAADEQVSTLTVENVNVLIRDTKDIITGDPYIDRIRAFVPAGNNPEYRDVIIVLRQLRQGLDRFKKSYFSNNLPEPESLVDLVEELNESKDDDE